MTYRQVEPRSWFAAAIATAIGGRLVGGDSEIRGVSIDSRAVVPGSLFVPIVGERNGHQFIDAARDAGAQCWLTSEPQDVAGEIVVSETSRALTALGRAAREELPERIVGITGSSGKTSTKDMLRAIFLEEGPTASSEKSFNNELGVPLTLVNSPANAVAAVIEMGARGKGHIATLCELARPTVGVIVNIGTAHRELFGSAVGTADAKSEIYDAIPEHGSSIVNLDDDLFAFMRARTRGRVLTFSANGRADADVRATAVIIDDELRASFHLDTPWGSAPVSLGARGLHQVENALAAAAAALATGSPLNGVIAGLATHDLSPLRMELHHTTNGVRILNDSYNANPSSMAAALRSLAAMSGTRRFAVLGTMAELGRQKLAFHLEIGALARELGITLAVGYREQDFGLVNVVSIGDALDALGPLGDGDVVLVKGSRVAGLESMAEALVAGNGGVQ